MKKLIALVVVIVVAYFAWDHFRPPKLAGKSIDESDRVTFVSAGATVSVADHLDAGTWTLILFTAPGSQESKALETRLEVAVRRLSTVRLVVMDVGGLDTPATRRLGLTTVPSAWLFDGVAKQTDDVAKILKTLGA